MVTARGRGRRSSKETTSEVRTGSWVVVVEWSVVWCCAVLDGIVNMGWWGVVWYGMV